MTSDEANNRSRTRTKYIPDQSRRLRKNAWNACKEDFNVKSIQNTDLCITKSLQLIWEYEFSFKHNEKVKRCYINVRIRKNYVYNQWPITTNERINYVFYLPSCLMYRNLWNWGVSINLKSNFGNSKWPCIGSLNTCELKLS